MMELWLYNTDSGEGSSDLSLDNRYFWNFLCLKSKIYACNAIKQSIVRISNLLGNELNYLHSKIQKDS
jgi:hypothetical protein